MSETTLKILLEELVTVQIICRSKDCGTIIELPLSRLEGKVNAATSKLECPVCNAVLQADHFDALGELARSFKAINKRKNDLSVQFVIRQPETQKP